MADTPRHAAFVPALLIACVLSGCAIPATPGSAEQADGLQDIPEDLLLDVGIAVFEASPLALDDDQSAFRSAEVLRAERNYLPHVVGKHLQASDKWGAVRVLTRPSAAMDVTVTGVIVSSDGETLAFRAKATDARGVVWFDTEYRASAGSDAYSTETQDQDPFAAAYAALAADMVESLSALSLDDLARIRRVTELAFARSMAPDAFAKHLTRTPAGGYELRRLPAEDDPMLGRVRDIRRREHLFIDAVNDYYDAFSVGIQEPYGEWRREAYSARKAQRDLKQKADAHLLLGSSRIVAGLAHMDSGSSSHLGFAWVTHGLALIRGAELSEGQIQERSEWLRDVGSLTEATLLPHTTELENRTSLLQTSVDQRLATLRSILDSLYREEAGLPRGPSPDPPLPKRSAESASFSASGPTHEPRPRPPEQTTPIRPRRILDSVAKRSAATRIPAAKVDETIDVLKQLLEDDVGGELVRNNTLMALGHLANDDGRAAAAFEHVVATACETLCPEASVFGTERPRERTNPTMRPGVRWIIWRAQKEIQEGRRDAAIRLLSEVAKSKSLPKLGIRTLRVAELATIYHILAPALLAKNDRDAAVDIYEKILALGPRVPRWQREICHESLALIHFANRNYEQSLAHQREWLRLSPWIARGTARGCVRLASFERWASQPIRLVASGNGSR